MMDRLDYEYETRGNRSFPRIKRKPSDYVKNCPVYVTCEPEETSPINAVRWNGENQAGKTNPVLSPGLIQRRA